MYSFSHYKDSFLFNFFLFYKYTVTVISEDCIKHTEFKNIKYSQN